MKETLHESSMRELAPGVDEGVSEADTEAPERENEALQTFSAVLSKRRDEWVRARAAEGVDARWVEDLDQFNGEDPVNRAAANMMVSVEQGFPVTTRQAHANRSTVFVQVTRQKTNAAVARLGDILLPTEERNFAVEPTPLPQMPAWVTTQTPPVNVPPPPGPAAQGGNAQGGPAPTGLGSMPGVPMGPAAPQPGQASPPGGAPGGPQAPPSPAELLQKQMQARQAEAMKRSKAMMEKIADCFAQTDYNAQCRRVLHDAGVLGTGVLKGPVVLSTVRKAWKRVKDPMGGEIWSLEVNETLAPASFRVDPRNVYPDPACADNVQNGRGIFEVQQLTRKQVRELRKQPGYITSQLVAVLEEGPKPSREIRPLHDPLRQQRDLVADEVFDHWIYWGEIERDDLVAAGVELDDEDPLTVYSACVEMINSTVVRAYLNPLPDGQLPYDFFQWELRPGSVWGYGIPYLMRSQQRVVNAAWRMILDNAGVSSGPQIVIKPGLITPADQQWTLTSRKIWYATDDVEDVSKAFATFEFNAHQAELQAIIEMAEKLSDAETAVPQIAQGEKGNSPETLGGMQMLMQSANVVLKRLVKQYDDTITKPHVRRYYDYLMEYDPDPSIKGDFQVVALGSSSLVVRDIQNQALMQLLQLAANPIYAPLVNSDKLFRKVLQAQHLDPAEVMNTEAEVAAIKEAQARAQQEGGNDPRIAAAMARAKSDAERTVSQERVAMATIQQKQQALQLDLQAEREKLLLQRELEMLKMANDRGLTIEQIKAALAQATMKEQTKLALHGSDQDQAAYESARDTDVQQRQRAEDTQREDMRSMQEQQRAEADAQRQREDAQAQAERDERLAEAQRRHEQALERERGRNAVKVAKAKPAAKAAAKTPARKGARK